MSEASWESKEVAELRRKGAAERSRIMAEATARMVEEAGVAQGMRVLELGAGTGEVALLLSERVGPGGHVVATDTSAAMLDAARASVQAGGATNVTLEACDASAIALPEASFDAVVARNVLMFLDLDAALPGIRRVMRAGARVGATVWGPTARNPFHGLVLEAARAEGGWGDATMQLAKAFARGDRTAYEKAFVRAGFEQVRVHVVGATRQFADVDEATASMRQSPIHTAPIDQLPEGRRARAWERVEAGLAAMRSASGVELPAEWLVIGAGR